MEVKVYVIHLSKLIGDNLYLSNEAYKELVKREGTVYTLEEFKTVRMTLQHCRVKFLAAE